MSPELHRKESEIAIADMASGLSFYCCHRTKARLCLNKLRIDEDGLLSCPKHGYGYNDEPLAVSDTVD